MASNTPKTMSSRLMTMKFMQRSAAKSVTTSEPSTPNGPPAAKRVRLSNGSAAARSPRTPHTPSDQEILRTALEAEERKREEALEKALAQSGETKWVLSVQEERRPEAQDFRVVHAGFATIDAEDDVESGEEEPARPVRMQFGGGVKRPKKQQQPDPNDSEDSEEEDDSEEDSDDDSDDDAAAFIRQTKREAAAKAKEDSKARRRDTKETPRRPKVNEDSDLGGLRGGLSSGGRGGGNMSCFNCGGNHRKSECPKLQQQRGGSSGRGRQSGSYKRF